MVDGRLEHEFLGGDNRVRKHVVWVRQDVGEDIQVAGDPHEVDADVVLGRQCHGVQGQVSPRIDGLPILVDRPSIGDEEARFLGPLVAIETEMLIACLVEIPSLPLFTPQVGLTVTYIANSPSFRFIRYGSLFIG